MTITEIYKRDYTENRIIVKDTCGSEWRYFECEILEALKLPSQDIMDI